jgi:Ca2+-transporting ATPase
MHIWHELSAIEAIQQLGADPDGGLTPTEAKKRLDEQGPNELVERGAKGPWRILWEQLTAAMMIVLVVAAVVSLAVGDLKDAIVIIIIVALNALLGLSQEYRAEKAIAALKKLAVPRVKVKRGGSVVELSARDLVIGDLVILEAGALTPADGRVLKSVNLRIQESALTGESDAVEKQVDALSGADLPLGDRKNMCYMGTLVTYGHGEMIVTETGMRTELGRIAQMIQTVRQAPTPLQRRMEELGRWLAVVALVIVAFIFFAGLWRGEDPKLMFMTAISMAVAAVPEGLPAVMTVSLALGAQRMLRRRALIRKLPAVETLGSITVICSDKTGTLTENRMKVIVLDVANHRLDLTQHVGRLSSRVTLPEAGGTMADGEPALRLLLMGGVLCNDAHLKNADNQPDVLEALGDPTEVAIALAAASFGLRKDQLDKSFPRLEEIPFDSVRKRMTTVHSIDSSKKELPGGLDLLAGQGAGYTVMTKGAVDSLLEVSARVWRKEGIEPMNEEWRTRIQKAQEEIAGKGARVLGVAIKTLNGSWSKEKTDDLERDLTFVGMIAMMDPPRAEVKEAVNRCRMAGIRPVMITGDHPLTANYIANQLGISADGRALTGQDLEKLSGDQLEAAVLETAVYARVSPEHKLKIVQALQKKGQLAAMTGDGVNDAPALKKADIGVAMGITGTDVSKEASDMVLLDDNFKTIVDAVEEGRVIYDNIRKFIKYLLSTNAGELWVMGIGLALDIPLPLLPLQILWINLMTDGLPALALSVEPPEGNVMNRPPRKPNESVFARGLAAHILWAGALMGLVSLGIGYLYWKMERPEWQTMIFNTICLSQLCHVMAIRSGRDSLFRMGIGSNKPLLWAVLLSFALLLAVIYAPFLSQVFKTTALSPADFAISFILSTSIFWAVEFEKLLVRRRERKGQIS